MKFKHKVYEHKRKVGIDFGSFGPNSLGIRGQKGVQISIILGFRTITSVLVNRNQWNLNTRFMTTKGRLGLILGVEVPIVEELGAKKGSK